jgi:hypothetical protein
MVCRLWAKRLSCRETSGGPTTFPGQDILPYQWYGSNNNNADKQGFSGVCGLPDHFFCHALPALLRVGIG